MKSNFIVLTFFLIGCVLGWAGLFPEDFDTHQLSVYVLYCLMFQVGISIGSDKKLKPMIKSIRFKMLLLPISTIIGTLLFSALVSLILTQWSLSDCLAVGSGFAYYSLSSILITELKEASLGVQVAAELGTIALLSNIIREMIALLGTPLLARFFGRFAPISAAGVNSMDVVLPAITRYSGTEMTTFAIFHGLLVDTSVPFFVTFFCSL